MLVTSATVELVEDRAYLVCRAYYVGGKEGNYLYMEVGGDFPSLGGGDFTKIILMRAAVVRPKSGENK